MRKNVPIWVGIIFCFALNSMGTALYAQGNTVSGTVTDARTGDTMPGVNILIKGTSQGTTTNAEGLYRIDIPSAADTLVFTFIGYERMKVAIDGRTEIDIELNPVVLEAEELVVVGYGIQEKATMTGSVGTISANEIENRTVASAEEILQGQVPGLNVIRNSGQPGNQSISLQIRGTSTFSGNPVLVLIDGVPSSLDRVNPNDIENISVLKDAASASIYGSRASGGVILVTTKTGQKGEPQFSYRSTVSMQSPTRFPTKVSALDHMLAQNEMRENDGGPPKYSQEEIEAASSPRFKEWDWDDFMFDNALQTNQNFSVSGGTDLYDYYASIGYLYQDGIFLNSDYQRFNVRLNQNVRLGDRLKIGLNAAYSPAVRTAPATANFTLIAQTSSLIGIRTDDGKWLTHPERTGAGRNPLYAASEDGGQELNKSSRITGNLKIDYDILPSLVLTGSYGLVQNSARNRTYTALLTFYEQYNPEQVASTTDYNTLDIDYRSSIHQNTNLLLNYVNTFQDHSLEVLAGVTAEWYLEEADGIYTRDFLTDNLYTINAGSSDPTLWDIYGTTNEWALASGISRAKYAYQDKYLLEGSVRYDGSSRFAEGLRWGLFPSVSAGWIVSEESFLQNNRVFTFLKIRGSWGQVGNQNAVGYYPFASTLSQSSVYFGGNTYRTVQTAGTSNPLLTWETKESLNLGIEGSLFENILEYEFDVFKERTEDILLVLPVPTTFGQGSPVQNAGVVENRGWEVQLHHRNSIGDFSYGVSLQVSDAKNKVIDMSGISPRITGATITEEGRPMNEWYGYETDGFFQSEAEVENHASQNPLTSPGDIKYVDQNGDGQINSEDRVRLGSSETRFPFGIKINLNYRNFDFTAFGQGAMTNLNRSSGATAYNFASEATTIRTYHLDRWSPDNPDARFPIYRNGRNGINTQFSDFWLEDASYFRLKHIELGYNVSQRLLNRINIRDARVFVSAENLFVLTDYLGYDPEMPNAARYPLPKLFNFGINLNF